MTSGGLEVEVVSGTGCGGGERTNDSCLTCYGKRFIELIPTLWSRLGHSMLLAIATRGSLPAEARHILESQVEASAPISQQQGAPIESPAFPHWNRDYRSVMRSPTEQMARSLLEQAQSPKDARFINQLLEAREVTGWHITLSDQTRFTLFGTPWKLSPPNALSTKLGAALAPLTKP